MGSATLMRGRSILVVEDEPLIKLELTDLFQSAGAHVIAASTCQQGLIAIGRQKVSAALLDYGLWEGNVAPLCRHLAERQVPFMFYTGYLDLERSYPHAVIVQKPAGKDVLLAAMAGLIAATEPQSDTQSPSAIGRQAEERGLPRSGSVTTRFDAPGYRSSAPSRRTHREMFSTSASAAEFISGTVVVDAALRRKNSGTPGAKVLISIKSDTGAKPLTGSAGEVADGASRTRSLAESDSDA
jgi:DNA-binding response OmpR family regulator